MSKVVVVIEDQEEVRENLIETLELSAYQVYGAADGHAGVKLVREVNPHLVLCDVMMPKLDGYGVLEVLKKDDKTSQIPFIFLTAKAEREDLRRGMNLGATDYITKPFFQDEILRVVDQRIAQEEQQAVNTPFSLGGHENPTDILDILAARGRTRMFEDRVPILYAEDKANLAFRVESGRVRLYRETDFGKSITVDVLSPGSWYGIGEILSSGVYACTVTAFPEAKLLLIDGAEVQDVADHHPRIFRWLVSQQAQDLDFRADQLVQVAYFSVRKRVAEFLLRFGKFVEGKAKLEDFRREDIAESVATTPESVTRVLTEFRKDSLVELHASGDIILLDTTRLQKVPS